MNVYERLLKYVVIRTPSNEESDTTPSTQCQFDLANVLKKEMKIIQVSVDFFNALQNYNKSSRSQNKVYFLIPVFILLLCYTAK